MINPTAAQSLGINSMIRNKSKAKGNVDDSRKELKEITHMMITPIKDPNLSNRSKSCPPFFLTNCTILLRVVGMLSIMSDIIQFQLKTINSVFGHTSTF